MRDIVANCIMPLLRWKKPGYYDLQEEIRVIAENASIYTRVAAVNAQGHHVMVNLDTYYVHETGETLPSHGHQQGFRRDSLRGISWSSKGKVVEYDMTALPVSISEYPRRDDSVVNISDKYAHQANWIGNRPIINLIERTTGTVFKQVRVTGMSHVFMCGDYITVVHFRLREYHVTMFSGRGQKYVSQRGTCSRDACVKVHPSGRRFSIICYTIHEAQPDIHTITEQIYEYVYCRGEYCGVRKSAGIV